MIPLSSHPGKAGIAPNQARAIEQNDGSKSSNSQQNKNERKTFHLVTTPTLLALSFAIQLGLLLYANHIDSHPERYGGLKYTDVDWRVVSDGARLIFRPNEGDSNIARGWLVRYLGLSIGDPYERATFRYTPLLALLVSPSLIHPLLGRLLLVIISLCIPPLLLFLPAPVPAPASSSRSSANISRVCGTTTLVALGPAPTPAAATVPFWAVHGLWTLNPFVLNITTRGSPESVICLLVVLLLVALRKGKEVQAAVWLGLAVSWKIYPAIYVPAIWSFLARPKPKPTGRDKHEEDVEGGWFGWRVWRFGVVVGMTFGIVNGILWAIWGQPFLEHTFLYHLTRQDHRHNFSPYFYPIYLSFYNKFASSSSSSSSSSSISISSGAARILTKVIRNPLTSFFPQLSLVLLAGFGLESASTLEFALFMQTAVFVVFNKVCTSQYFMWFLPLLPPILPSLSHSNSLSAHNSRSRTLSARKTTLLVGSWVAAQAIWLSTAYQLELMGQDVFLGLWFAGLGLFGISIWVLGELIEAFGFGGVSDQLSDRVERREKEE